jgi:hypothetical protein
LPRIPRIKARASRDNLRHPWLICALISVAALASPAPSSTVQDAERAFEQLRYLKDQIDVTGFRGADRNSHGVSRSRMWSDFRSSLPKVQEMLSRIQVEGLSEEDRSAVTAMRRALDEFQTGLSGLSDGTPHRAPSDCGTPAENSMRLDELTLRTYACFGSAARNIKHEGKVLDRLSVLGLLPRTTDPQARRRLFLSLAPVWSSVNGDGGAASPYRRIVQLRASSWRKGDSPFQEKARALGVELPVLEHWLTAILRTWRDETPGDGTIDPWDFHYLAGRASRLVSPHIPKSRLRWLNDRYYRGLGADVRDLNVNYDLQPRSDKEPVAFTTFGARNREIDGRWHSGEFWVFASYRTGGLDNLSELLHETGHAIHLGGIRTRPAFQDWPDSDTFTEALADVAAFDLYEPEWQRKYLGVSAAPADSLRAKYAAVVMDIAWALFEMRLHRDPAADPNRIWTDLTQEFFHIRPQQELSWWAMRGQLVNSPGYMVNYALGSILTADLRARIRELRGPRAVIGDDPGLYPWLLRNLYRFGLARPSRTVIEEFLGRPLSPRALLDEMSRMSP